MVQIYIQKHKVKFDKDSKTFSVKGKYVKFATRYELINQKTGNFTMFELVESTGSEWDKNTIWKYENKNGFKLNVGNENVTQSHIDNYLRAKNR